MSTIVKNIHILKDGVWRPISKVFHQGEWKKMKGIFYDGVWYEIGSTCVVMPDGCAIATNEHPRWNESGHYGTNNFGLNILPCGRRTPNGDFIVMGTLGGFAFYTDESTIARYFYLSSTSSGISYLDYNVAYSGSGYSYRCVKNYVGNLLDGTIIKNDYMDGSGNKYDSVVIGDQLWTTKNLHTTKYQDGTDIPYIENAATWKWSYGYCWYNNDYTTYGQYYGGLYKYLKGSHYKLVEQNGYELPSHNDFTKLINYVASTNWCNGVSVTNSNVAQFLKSCRQVNHPLADMQFYIDIQEGIYQVKVYRNGNLWVTFNTTQEVSLPAELGDIYRLEITVLSGGISIFNHTEGTISYYGNSVDKSFDMHTLPYNITLENTAL